MPRQTYTPRVDTKVRLRQDHADLLARAVDETGLSRNRLIEIALDGYFKPVQPRMPRPTPDQELGQGDSRGTSRTQPRVQRIGEAQAAASPKAGTILTTPARTRKSPRRNIP